MPCKPAAQIHQHVANKSLMQRNDPENKQCSAAATRNVWAWDEDRYLACCVDFRPDPALVARSRLAACETPATTTQGGLSFQATPETHRCSVSARVRTEQKPAASCPRHLPQNAPGRILPARTRIVQFAAIYKERCKCWFQPAHHSRQAHHKFGGPFS
jgi:hypothetical protein